MTQLALSMPGAALAVAPGGAPKKRVKRRPKPVVAATAPVEYTTSTDVEGRAVYTLRFPAPATMKSVNSGNQHWRVTAPLHETWRNAAFLHAKAAKLPTGLARIRYSIELRFPRAVSVDPHNYYTHVVKPCVDAIGPPFQQVIRKGAMAGQVRSKPGLSVVDNDDQGHVDGPHIMQGPKVADPKRSPFGEVVVTITDLSEVAA